MSAWPGHPPLYSELISEMQLPLSVPSLSVQWHSQQASQEIIQHPTFSRMILLAAPLITKVSIPHLTSLPVMLCGLELYLSEFTILELEIFYLSLFFSLILLCPKHLHIITFLFLIFLLVENCFIILCWFLLTTQSVIVFYILSHSFPIPPL